MRSWEWFANAVCVMSLTACGNSEGHKTGGGNGSTPKSGSVGAPCIAADELSQDFSGFAVREVNVETLSPGCDSGMCLTNNFQGRVSCPYGQSDTQATTDPQCFVPESEDPIQVPVEPQLLDRSASKSVTCSCQCDGPADGPFCSCPSGTVCEDPFANLEPQRPAMPAKYCIPVGSLYDPVNAPFPVETCDASSLNCGDPRPYPPP